MTSRVGQDTVEKRTKSLCFDAFTATKFYEALLGKQPCKCNKMHRRFVDKLRPHLLGARW
jgi:hypothetical protein